MAMLAADIVSAGANHDTPIITKPPKKGTSDRCRQP